MNNKIHIYNLIYKIKQIQLKNIFKNIYIYI